jgi:hypothetical protein
MRLHRTWCSCCTVHGADFLQTAPCVVLRYLFSYVSFFLFSLKQLMAAVAEELVQMHYVM